MKKFMIFVLTVATLSWMAVAQTPASNQNQAPAGQTSGQASSQTQGTTSTGATTSASPSGVSAGTSTDTSASQDANAPTGKGSTTGTANGAAAASTNASANQNGASANSGLASGTVINATLSKSIDSKKAKAGDAVEAKTTSDVKAEGKTIIPRGSKLIGHITQASARGKGDADSTLGIAFDHAVLKNGQQ